MGNVLSLSEVQARLNDNCGCCGCSDCPGAWNWPGCECVRGFGEIDLSNYTLTGGSVTEEIVYGPHKIVRTITLGSIEMDGTKFCIGSGTRIGRGKITVTETVTSSGVPTPTQPPWTCNGNPPPAAPPREWFVSFTVSYALGGTFAIMAQSNSPYVTSGGPFDGIMPNFLLAIVPTVAPGTDCNGVLIDLADRVRPTFAGSEVYPDAITVDSGTIAIRPACCPCDPPNECVPPAIEDAPPPGPGAFDATGPPFNNGGAYTFAPPGPYVLGFGSNAPATWSLVNAPGGTLTPDASGTSATWTWSGNGSFNTWTFEVVATNANGDEVRIPVVLHIMPPMQGRVVGCGCQNLSKSFNVKVSGFTLCDSFKGPGRTEQDFGGGQPPYVDGFLRELEISEIDECIQGTSATITLTDAIKVTTWSHWTWPNPPIVSYSYHDIVFSISIGIGQAVVSARVSGFNASPSSGSNYWNGWRASHCPTYAFGWSIYSPVFHTRWAFYTEIPFNCSHMKKGAVATGASLNRCGDECPSQSNSTCRRPDIGFSAAVGGLAMITACCLPSPT